MRASFNNDVIGIIKRLLYKYKLKEINIEHLKLFIMELEANEYIGTRHNQYLLNFRFYYPQFRTEIYSFSKSQLTKYFVPKNY